MLYFDGEDREFAPRTDGRFWNALPLETWFVEVREKKGSRRNYMSPFDMYEASVGRNAAIKEERTWAKISFIGGRGERQGFGKIAPMAIERVEGLKDGAQWIVHI